MPPKPTYEELEARIRELENQSQDPSAANDRDIIRTLSESFQQLANLSQDAIYLFDIESGTFPFFNKRFLELFETVEIGQPLLSTFSAIQRIHPDDVEKLRNARHRTLETGGTHGEVEYRHLDRDGKISWLQDRWSVVRDKENKAVAIEGFIRDNTLKKQAEDELAHSRNSALIGSYIIQDKRFQYVNPEFCRITGFSREELINRVSMDLVHEDHKACVKEQAALMLKGENTTPYEFRIVNAQGHPKWVMETVTSVRHEGARATLGYFMDTTRQKQVEKEHREKETLKAILEMAGAVSHELNNPLQVVSMGIDKLEDPNLDPARKEELFQLVKNHTQRIIELSAKIQRISKYSAKDYIQGKKIFDIDAAAKE